MTTPRRYQAIIVFLVFLAVATIGSFVYTYYSGQNAVCSSVSQVDSAVRKVIQPLPLKGYEGSIRDARIQSNKDRAEARKILDQGLECRN